MPELTASSPISAEISTSDKPIGTKHITENGVYDVSVYKNANVAVPEPEGNIELTHNEQTYDVADKATATVNLPLQTLTVHPSINDIIIRPSQGYEGIKKLTMTAVTAAIDSNIQPENITYGKSILGVNGSLMPPTIIQKSITVNGTYAAEDDNADGYSEVTVNVPIPAPAEEKAVNFYNYLGELIYGLTFQEALALTEMPPAPDIDGMDFQEWNWSLATVQAYAQNKIRVTVGAIYDTDDHSTRFYFHNEKYTALDELTIGVQMDANTSATIDWGDGTTTTLENTSSLRANLTATKNDYAIASETKIIIVSIHGKIYSLFRQGYQTICFAGNEMLLKKVEVGSDCSTIGEYAFNGSFIFLPNLSAISIANGVVSLGNIWARTLTKLKALCFPTSLSSISGSAPNNYSISILSYAENSPKLGVWDSANSLSWLNLPPLINAINAYAYRYARALTYIYIPKTVSSIGTYAFAGSGLRVVDLSGFEDYSTVPSLENTNAFPGSAIFLVKNQEMLDAFEAATNWSTYAGRYQIKDAV